MAGHLDVHTGAVAAAGRATGATSADWEGYARTVRSALTDAAGLVHSGVVAGAIGGYGACGTRSSWRSPKMWRRWGATPERRRTR